MAKSNKRKRNRAAADTTPAAPAAETKPVSVAKPAVPAAKTKPASVAKPAGKKPFNKKQKTNANVTHPPSDSDSDSSPQKINPNNLHILLEPYTKEQLIDLISNFSIVDSSLFNRICSIADADVTHKKIFVHGLGWDSNRETLIEAFKQYGPIDECSVVMDKSTGKCKGYGFVVFKSRKGAAKALEQPAKMINNRMTNCQLASLGASAQSSGPDNLARKIYVSNVNGDVDKVRLREFFAKFGEIETGPLGFDLNTGKPRGYALFVYKKVEDARKVLEEPYKMFDGRQLHCQQASDGKKNKDAIDAAAVSSSMPQQQAPLVSPLFSGMPGAPNMFLNPQQYAAALHPFYGGMFLGSPAGVPSPMLAAGMMNPGMMNPGMISSGLMNPGMMNPSMMNPSVMNPSMMNSNSDMISPSNSLGAVAGQGGLRPSSQGLGNSSGSPSMHGIYGSSLHGNSSGSPSMHGIYGSSLPSFGLPQAYSVPQLHRPPSSRPNGPSGAYPLRKCFFKSYRVR